MANGDYRIVSTVPATWINEAGALVDGSTITFEVDDTIRGSVRVTNADIVSGKAKEIIAKQVAALKAL